MTTASLPSSRSIIADHWHHHRHLRRLDARATCSINAARPDICLSADNNGGGVQLCSALRSLITLDYIVLVASVMLDRSSRAPST